MKQQVGGFADQLVVALGHRRERDLDAFFAHLLRHASRAIGPQARGVAAFRALATRFSITDSSRDRKASAVAVVPISSPKQLSVPL